MLMSRKHEKKLPLQRNHQLLSIFTLFTVGHGLIGQSTRSTLSLRKSWENFFLSVRNCTFNCFIILTLIWRSSFQLQVASCRLHYQVAFLAVLMCIYFQPLVYIGLNFLTATTTVRLQTRVIHSSASSLSRISVCLSSLHSVSIQLHSWTENISLILSTGVSPETDKCTSQQFWLILPLSPPLSNCLLSPRQLADIRNVVDIFPFLSPFSMNVSVVDLFFSLPFLPTQTQTE